MYLLEFNDEHACGLGHMCLFHPLYTTAASAHRGDGCPHLRCHNVSLGTFMWLATGQHDAFLVCMLPEVTASIITSGIVYQLDNAVVRPSSAAAQREKERSEGGACRSSRGRKKPASSLKNVSAIERHAVRAPLMAARQCSVSLLQIRSVHPRFRPQIAVARAAEQQSSSGGESTHRRLRYRHTVPYLARRSMRSIISRPNSPCGRHRPYGLLTSSSRLIAFCHHRCLSLVPRALPRGSTRAYTLLAILCVPGLLLLLLLLLHTRTKIM